MSTVARLLEVGTLVKAVRKAKDAAFSRIGNRGFISGFTDIGGKKFYLVTGLLVGTLRHGDGIYPPDAIVRDAGADLRAAKVAYDGGVRAIQQTQHARIEMTKAMLEQLAEKHGISQGDVLDIMRVTLEFQAVLAYTLGVITTPFDTTVAVSEMAARQASARLVTSSS